jgi:hypothetical protein
MRGAFMIGRRVGARFCQTGLNSLCQINYLIISTAYTRSVSLFVALLWANLGVDAFAIFEEMGAKFTIHP